MKCGETPPAKLDRARPAFLLLPLKCALVPELQEADDGGRYSEANGQDPDSNEPTTRRDQTDCEGCRSGHNGQHRQREVKGNRLVLDDLGLLDPHSGSMSHGVDTILPPSPAVVCRRLAIALGPSTFESLGTFSAQRG